MPRLTKVLVANRGEIAVRVVRACRDAGLASVAVYADPDRDALFVRLADEAFALGGNTAAESYLDIGKVVETARRAGADGIHPGYGFLSENAAFAQAVIDAGLIWIGPTPQAIRDLGDKVTARHIAMRAGAPLVPGTPDPVSGAAEVEAFADEYGLPIAIKAAFGGGGRGMKVARERREIPELYESAVREATAAFGRGECFVERYLDKPRHVEAQVLADTHGNVIVVGTRDCSLQRRFQKLVEEAPAPFLSDEQRATIHEAAKAICREAGYHGAGTVEFLVGQDGLISFLEVNTRLQVEHPVSEETSGLDLVREQFRIANGDPLPLTDDPEPRGHSIEFRINGEDAGRGFLPAPGTVSAITFPAGPGVRVDAGVEDGVRDRRAVRLAAGQADRDGLGPRPGSGALAPRTGRVPGRGHGDGTSVPPAGGGGRGVRPVVGRALHRPHPVDRDRVGQHRHRRSTAASRPRTPTRGSRWSSRSGDGGWRCRFRPTSLSAATPAQQVPAVRTTTRKRHGKGASLVSGDAVTAPMQGTVIKVAVSDGDTIAAGDLVVVLEAMKMENPVTAHKSGTVTSLSAEPGGSVSQGAVLCEIKD